MSVSFSVESLAERITGCLEEARFTLLAANGGGLCFRRLQIARAPLQRRGQRRKPMCRHPEQQTYCDHAREGGGSPKHPFVGENRVAQKPGIANSAHGGTRHRLTLQWRRKWGGSSSIVNRLLLLRRPHGFTRLFLC